MQYSGWNENEKWSMPFKKKQIAFESEIWTNQANCANGNKLTS